MTTDTPEGRRSSPAGALVNGSPYDVARDAKPGSAVSGGRVVHCKRERYDVYIGRPSKWGNPFAITKQRTRDMAVNCYREWVVDQPELMAALPELRGKVLGCWCAPNACHGDVLVALAERYGDQERS